MEEGCKVDFERTPDGVLRAEVAGLRSVASTIGYWEAILAQVREAKPTGLLVIDGLVGEELSASEWKTLVVHVQEDGALADVPIAHVKPFSFDQINYCERYAKEAGLAAHAFRREPDAVAWLQARAG